MNLEKKLESLKNRVLKSFADVQYPKGIIAPHECDECFDLRKTFKNQNWKTIDTKIIEENYSQLPLFSDEAFHYFLPAYLIYSLENFNDADDNMVCEFTIYGVSPSKTGIREDLDYWKYKFSNFTIEQINLIYDFLDLVKANESESFRFFDKIVDDGKVSLKTYIEPNLK